MSALAFAAGEHPRLLFDAAELAALREACASGLRTELLAATGKLCAAMMDRRSPLYLDFAEREREIWSQRSGIFIVLPSLTTLAVGYALTGDAAIGDYARRAALAIIDHQLADVTSSAWGVRDGGWRHGPGHDKGKTAQAMALVYDLCFDRFAADERERYLQFARDSVAIAARAYNVDQAQVANNRGVRGILAAFWYCLACAGDTDIDDAAWFLSRGERAIEQYLGNAHDPDGAPYEGPGYASCLGFLAAASEALRRSGGPDLLVHPTYERAAEYLLYELVPGGAGVNPLNDCYPDAGSVAGCLHLLGSDRGRLIPWLAHQLDLHPRRRNAWLEVPASGSGLHYLQGELLLYFLRWWRDDAAVVAPAELGYPRSRAFPVRGVCSMRTGWRDDDWLVTHFCGPQRLMCHAQADQNNVACYDGAAVVLADAGYGEADVDTTRPKDRWFAATDAHNCVLVDGRGQRGAHPKDACVAGRLLAVELGGQPEGTPSAAAAAGARGTGDGSVSAVAAPRATVDTSLGDASACYDDPHRALARCRRRVALVDQPPVRFLAVLDVVAAGNGDTAVDILWHTDASHEVVVEGDYGAVIQARGRAAPVSAWRLQVLYPPQVAVAVEAQRGRQRLRVTSAAAVVEVVTVLYRAHSGDEAGWAESFSCEPAAGTAPGDGRFVVRWSADGRQSSLQLSAATTGPLQQPLAFVEV